MDKVKHNPKHYYDCKPCKFNWCCGYTCGCALKVTGKTYPQPPEHIKIAVIEARQAAGLIEWTMADKNNLN